VKKILNIIVAMLALTGTFKAQVSNDFFAESRLTLQSEDKYQNLFETSTEFAYMLLNTTNGDFILNTDASKLTTGNPKMDSILISKGPQPISFKGNIAENLFLFNQQINDEKLYNMPGQLTINNITVDCVAVFDPVNYSDRSDTKNYRIDFRLSVEPGKLVIAGLENKINKQLIIEVKAGKLNTRQ